MGSGRGDRSQSLPAGQVLGRVRCDASMGSGRGDRNQWSFDVTVSTHDLLLQWGPVVVTGISALSSLNPNLARTLQWGPVVVTGISTPLLRELVPPP